MSRHTVDASLEDWKTLESGPWDSILIGNGASMAVWPKFGYGSLFDIAKNAPRDGLATDDVQLFTSAGTENFEQVLSELAIAYRINSSLRIRAQVVKERYDSIKVALIAAVRSVHVEWSAVETSIILPIRTALLRYGSIFSLNYDLLIYWAMNSQPSGAGFCDFFWGTANQFDIGNTLVYGGKRAVYFVHGGIHLTRGAGGRSLKRTAAGGSLLSQFDPDITKAESPLFVAEGDSEAKLQAIRRSDYLGFAYMRLAHLRKPMVIFGTGLGSSDAHIARAINSSGIKQLAISCRKGKSTDIKKRKNHFGSLFSGMKLVFFDAASHPLGDPSLTVP